MDISASPARTLADKAPPSDLPPAETARAARLRYVADSAPGITRRRLGTAFAYRDAVGHAIRDAATLARIKALAVPPATRRSAANAISIPPSSRASPLANLRPSSRC